MERTSSSRGVAPSRASGSASQGHRPKGHCHVPPSERSCVFPAIRSTRFPPARAPRGSRPARGRGAGGGVPAGAAASRGAAPARLLRPPCHGSGRLPVQARLDRPDQARPGKPPAPGAGAHLRGDRGGGRRLPGRGHPKGPGSGREVLQHRQRPLQPGPAPAAALRRPQPHRHHHRLLHRHLAGVPDPHRDGVRRPGRRPLPGLPGRHLLRGAVGVQRSLRQRQDRRVPEGASGRLRLLGRFLPVRQRRPRRGSQFRRRRRVRGLRRLRPAGAGRGVRDQQPLVPSLGLRGLVGRSVHHQRPGGGWGLHQGQRLHHPAPGELQREQPDRDRGLHPRVRPCLRAPRSLRHRRQLGRNRELGPHGRRLLRRRRRPSRHPVPHVRLEQGAAGMGGPGGSVRRPDRSLPLRGGNRRRRAQALSPRAPVQRVLPGREPGEDRVRRLPPGQRDRGLAHRQRGLRQHQRGPQAGGPRGGGRVEPARRR